MDEQNSVRCIVCDREYSRTDVDKYQPLKHFEDSCICQDCLNKEKYGWPKPQVKQKSS